ncbi:MAG TPA: M1 family metallopeptidase [Cytophagales bacterium]|nr:M1 family metallopeptidase [Cytophagales bacterium]
MHIKILSFLSFFFLIYLQAYTQVNNTKTFTRADSLRGMLTPLRTCFDVKFYHLDIKVDPATKYIEGSNKVVFQVLEPSDKIQLDLFENLAISKIIYKGEELRFTREFNAVFIDFPEKLEQGAIGEITVFYQGNPIVAEKPPWDGGFVWSKDKDGNPWVGVACEGIGASIWWPNKDHLSDEPDSMLISTTVPKGLINVSNGRLRKRVEVDDQWTRFDWFVSYPINNYNVTINIANYAHWRDYHINGDTLTLDYYVLPANIEKARKQFEQVKPMMQCYEEALGKYPFYRDGFKLIETSYLGMEHQSAIAYGNRYLTGYLGTDRSGLGLDFDFIIIHETGHEWWGNNVSCADIADMWIHESFCTYSESLYVSCIYGEDMARKYVLAQRSGIRNISPMMGIYGVNNEGDGDMYLKGSVVLNTLRNVINNDPLWFDILKGIQKEFALQTVYKKDIVNYINRRTGKDFYYFFDQYFGYAKIPVLEYKFEKKGRKAWLKYRWKTDEEDFRMPAKVTLSSARQMEFIYPTTDWQKIKLGVAEKDFKINNEDFYFNKEEIK